MTSTKTRKVTMAATQGDDLLARTYHIDGRVTAIEGRMDTFGAQLNRIEGALLNKASPWNISTVMGIIVMVCGLLVGISGYVDLQMKNVLVTVKRNTDVADIQETKIGELERFRAEMHYEVGSLNQKADNFKSMAETNAEYRKELDSRIREVEKESAESRVSRRAIGDYAKELGNILKGSQ